MASRRILRLTGPDTEDFLQGLTGVGNHDLRNGDRLTSLDDGSDRAPLHRIHDECRRVMADAAQRHE